MLYSTKCKQTGVVVVAGFSIQISERWGTVPPYGGGISLEGGGMAGDAVFFLHKLNQENLLDISLEIFVFVCC